MRKERKSRFETLSGIEIKPVYRPDDHWYFRDLPEEVRKIILADYHQRLGDPGEFPFARGVFEGGFRIQLPTIRQFSGRNLAPDTNTHLHYLLGIGQKGLSIAYDAPTIHGRDSDNEKWSLGYVGKDGVAVDTFADFQNLFSGIPRGKYSLSQTINLPAIVFLGMDLLLAKEQGIPFRELRGTLQNDILKEIISQKLYSFPLRHGMRLVGDMMEYCIKNLDPGYYPINFSGYHMGEAGASPIQELAITVKNGLTYFDFLVGERGLPADETALRMSAYFNCKGLWEEIAKYRAARRMWALELWSRGVRNPRALGLRFHVQNSGASFKRQEPGNNVIRGTIHALAALIGGANSVHLNSFDEEVALPSDEAVKEAIRTLQICSEEMNITDTVDPMGGSYYVEWLTDKMEDGAREIFRNIDDLGGMMRAIELGFPQLEIHAQSQKEAEAVDAKELVVVGINKYFDVKNQACEERKVYRKALRIPTMDAHNRQKERVARVKAGRDEGKVDVSLRRLADEARGKGILVEPVMEAVAAYATVEEIMFGALEPVFGHWRGPGD